MAHEEDKLATVPISGAVANALSPSAPVLPGRRYRYSEVAEGVSAGAVLENGASARPKKQANSWLNENWVWWALAIGAGLLAVFYFNTLRGLVLRWWKDAGWSHGFVVPVIAFVFIRSKWETFRRLFPQGSFWGLAVLIVGVWAGVLFRATGLPHMSGLSILVVLFGAVLFVLGWEHLKLLWLPIAYLGFAIPPPTPLYDKLALRLQVFATEFGAFLLPILGGQGSRRGTILDVSFPGYNPLPLNVEQACSGMRILVAFFALSVALAYSTDRPVWQKVTLAMCALPIAVFCNGLRVTFTGVMAVKVDPRWAEGNAHEYFGLLMLIPALLIQLLIMWVVDRIFVEVPEEGGSI